MREILKMIVVLAVITGASGLLLAYVNESTEVARKEQVLKFLKGPAVMQVLQGCSNDPLKDMVETEMGSGDKQRTVELFPAYKDGKFWALALEDKAGGFGGDIGVIVGIDVQNQKLLGIGVTTHKETPGLGARVKDDPSFAQGFKGIALDQQIAVSADGGSVAAISGATVSSRGVCEAAGKAVNFFLENQEEIDKLFSKGEGTAGQE